MFPEVVFTVCEIPKEVRATGLMLLTLKYFWQPVPVRVVPFPIAPPEVAAEITLFLVALVLIDITFAPAGIRPLPVTTIPTTNPLTEAILMVVEPDAVDPVVACAAVHVAAAVKANAAAVVAAEFAPATAAKLLVPRDIDDVKALAVTTASADPNSVGAIVIAPTKAAMAARRLFFNTSYPPVRRNALS